MEYYNGVTEKFCYEDLLQEGTKESKDRSLQAWLKKIDWSRAEEVEIDFYDGSKRKLDLESGEEETEEAGEEEDDEKQEDEDEDIGEDDNKHTSNFIQVPINPYKIKRSSLSGMNNFQYNEDDEFDPKKDRDDEDILGDYDFR